MRVERLSDALRCLIQVERRNARVHQRSAGSHGPSGPGSSTPFIRCTKAWTTVPAWRRLSPTHSKVGSCGSASGAGAFPRHRRGQFGQTPGIGQSPQHVAAAVVSEAPPLPHHRDGSRARSSADERGPQIGEHGIRAGWLPVLFRRTCPMRCKALLGARRRDVELARAFPVVLLPFDLSQIPVESVWFGARFIDRRHQAFEVVRHVATRGRDTSGLSSGLEWRPSPGTMTVSNSRPLALWMVITCSLGPRDSRAARRVRRRDCGSGRNRADRRRIARLRADRSRRGILERAFAPSRHAGPPSLHPDAFHPAAQRPAALFREGLWQGVAQRSGALLTIQGECVYILQAFPDAGGDAIAHQRFEVGERESAPGCAQDGEPGDAVRRIEHGTSERKEVAHDGAAPRADRCRRR